MASLIYNSGLEALLAGTSNLPSATVRAMLVTSAYVEDKDAHRFRTDVTNEVAIGAGYSLGGVSVTTGVLRDNATDRITLTFGDATWNVPSGQTLTSRKLIYYVSTGNATADRLLVVHDFGTNQVATNQPFTVAGSTIRLQN